MPNRQQRRNLPSSACIHGDAHLWSRYIFTCRGLLSSSNSKSNTEKQEGGNDGGLKEIEMSLVVHVLKFRRGSHPDAINHGQQKERSEDDGADHGYSMPATCFGTHVLHSRQNCCSEAAGENGYGLSLGFSIMPFATLCKKNDTKNKIAKVPIDFQIAQCLNSSQMPTIKEAASKRPNKMDTTAVIAKIFLNPFIVLHAHV